MGYKYFLGIFIPLLVFACTPQLQEQPTLKVLSPSIKTVTIQDMVSNPNEFVDVKVQVTGKLIFTGKNYFTDPKFAITDGTNNFSVAVWLPLEIPSSIPGKEKESLPLAMNHYVDKKITFQGVIKNVNEQFFLQVIEAAIIEQPKGEPKLSIISPKDGELVKSSKVTVQVDAENFDIVPVGNPVKEGEGHFHVWLDSEKKVTAEKTAAFENVVSGKHTITAELYRSDHSVLSPKIVKTIIINVESDYIPPQPVQQQGIVEFTVEADDNGFYPGMIKAKVGDKVKISFKFRDSSIYYAGLDVKGPFEDIKYKLKGSQPVSREFTIKGETKITSYWPSSGVKKADLTVEVEG